MGGVNYIIDDVLQDADSLNDSIKNLIRHPALSFVILFRLCSYFRKHKLNPINLLLFLLCYPFYKILSVVLGIEILLGTQIGTGFSISHNHSIAINRNAGLGNYCRIYQCCTIGESKGETPSIGNNVTIYPNSVIIGGIKVGDNVIIGAGSVVVKNIPSDVIVAGNPAKIIKTISI